MLPRPNVCVARTGQGELTEEKVRGMLCNPIYAGLGPYPAIVTDEQWVTCAKQMIEEEGPEQFLVNLLYCLRESFAFLNEEMALDE
jgi:hypothetical protein